MCVAMEIEFDAGKLFQKAFQSFSAHQFFSRMVVLKKREMVSEKDVVFFRDLNKHVSQMVFDLFGEVASRRDQGGSQSRIESDQPPVVPKRFHPYSVSF